MLIFVILGSLLVRVDQYLDVRTELSKFYFDIFSIRAEFPNNQNTFASSQK